MRSVKNTDARIPGDQFFTDTEPRGCRRSTREAARRRVLTPRAYRAALVSAVADRPARAVRCAGSGDARRDRQGAERHVRPAPLPAAGATPAPARKLAERGRISWSPDGERLTFVRGGRLMVMPAEGAASRSRGWSRSSCRSANPSWSPDRIALRDARRRSVGDRSGARAGQAGHVHDGAAVHGCLRGVGRRHVEEPDTWLHRSGQRPGVEHRRRVVVLPRGRQQDATTKRSIATPSPPRSSRPCVRGEESFGRLQATSAGVIASIEAATRPTICGCSAPAGSATRITNLNPQLARFSFSKPELFYFDNADGDRLGALLYKPAGIGANEKVPVITWVYEKMTPGHPPLQRARSDVHQPWLRHADAQRQSEGRPDRRLV